MTTQPLNRFATAFAELISAAKMTPRDLEARLAADARTGKSALDAWTRGTSLPQSEERMLAAVQMCLDLAAARRAPLSPRVPRNALGWQKLLADSTAERDDHIDQRRRRSKRQGRSSSATTSVSDWGPLGLGVHRAIGAAVPTYVPRAHDAVLRALLVSDEPRNRLVVLRGGSCTGKSRTAFEAVRVCRPTAPLLFPRTAIELVALLEGTLPTGSVLWLDELRHYVDDADGVVAMSRLAQQLTHRDRAVVLTGVWPEFWTAYTRPQRTGPGVPDLAKVTRPLLLALPSLTAHPIHDLAALDVAHGGVIDIPNEFLTSDIALARTYADSALSEALRAADRTGSTGEVTQHLAGAFALVEHYHDPGANQYGKALITAALDAVRLGCSLPLSPDLLHHAAPGYLDDRSRAVAQPQQDSLRTRGWDYATQILDGTVSALDPVASPGGLGVSGYRPADYLDQQARRDRSEAIPPDLFWSAVRAHAALDDQAELGEAAWDRGLYRDAAVLWMHAANCGHAGAAEKLIARLHQVLPSDNRPAMWVAEKAGFQDISKVARFASALHHVGAKQLAKDLASRAATEVSTDDLLGIGYLVTASDEIGERDQARNLAVRAAAALSVDDENIVSFFCRLLRRLDAHMEAGALTARAIADARAENLPVLAHMLDVVNGAGAIENAKAMVARLDPILVSTRHPTAVVSAIGLMRLAGADDQADAIAARVVAEADLDDLNAVIRALHMLCTADASEHARALANRVDVNAVAMDDVRAIANLLAALITADAVEQAQLIAARVNPTAMTLSAPAAVAALASQLHAMGLHDQARILISRLAANVDSKDLADDPQTLAEILTELCAAGARELAETIATSAVVEIPMEEPVFLAVLVTTFAQLGFANSLKRLRERRQLTMSSWTWGEHRQSGQDRFPFGQDANGNPAEPWTWDDLLGTLELEYRSLNE